jgi:hypothetical protein
MGRKNLGDIHGARTLICVNIFFMLASIAIIVAAAISYDQLKDVRTRADVLNSLNLDVFLQIALFCGVGMFLTAVLGIVAAIGRFKKLMVLYVVLIFILLAIQLAMGVVLIIMDKNDVYEAYREDSAAGQKRRADFEVFMECCGWSYITEEFFPERLACIAQHPTYTKACGDQIQHLINTKVKPTAIVLLVASLFSLVGLIAAIILIMSQKQKKEDFFDNPFSS